MVIINANKSENKFKNKFGSVKYYTVLRTVNQGKLKNVEKMKTTLFISNGLQVDLGIYIASGEIERVIKGATFNGTEYQATVRVQGKNIIVISDDNVTFDVDNILTRRAN